MSENAVTTSPVQEKALEIIAQELELEASEFTLTGHFVDDYDADSLALIVVARIEKELGVAIPKTELVKMIDLEAVFGLIASYDGAGSASRRWPAVPEPRSVAVTGLGTVSCVGIGIDAFTAAVKEGRVGASEITSFDTTGFPPRWRARCGTSSRATCWSG